MSETPKKPTRSGHDITMKELEALSPALKAYNLFIKACKDIDAKKEQANKPKKEEKSDG